MSVHQQQIGSGVVNRVKRFDRAAERSRVVPGGVERRVSSAIGSASMITIFSRVLSMSSEDASGAV
jgi:hypothetical protein